MADTSVRMYVCAYLHEPFFALLHATHKVEGDGLRDTVPSMMGTFHVCHHHLQVGLLQVTGVQHGRGNLIPKQPLDLSPGECVGQLSSAHLFCLKYLHLL